MRVAVKSPDGAKCGGRPELARVTGIVGSLLLFVAIGLVVTVSTRGAESRFAPPGKEATASYSFFIYCPVVQKNYPPMPDLSTSRKTVAWSADDSTAVLTYTIHLTNTGTLTATNVRLTDTIPAGTAYVSGTLVPIPACVYTDTVTQDQIACQGLTVGISQTVAVSFEAEVGRDTSCLVHNTALVDDGFHQVPLALTAPATLTLPLPWIVNCGFETGDLACWQSGGGLVVGTVLRIWKGGPCLADGYSVDHNRASGDL